MTRIAALSRKTATAALFVATLALVPLASAPAEARDGRGAFQADIIINVGRDGRHRGGRGYGHHHGGYHYAHVPPRRIVRRLYRRGMTNISPVRLKGDTYRVRATGPRGARLKFVIDAYTGQVRRVIVLRPPVYRHRPRHHHGTIGYGFRWSF